jgi:hypothetical protein
MAEQKLSPAQQIHIVTELRELTLQGYRSKDLNVWAQEKYGIGRGQVGRYLKKVTEGFLQIDKKVKGELRAKYRERLEKMYNNALLVQKDTTLALNIQKELNKLIEGGEAETTMPDINVIFKYEGDSSD